MKWNHWFREVHRWTSMVFMAAVLLNILLIGRVSEETSTQVGLATLLPLFLLMITGSWLFVLPYVTKWRRRRQA